MASDGAPKAGAMLSSSSSRSSRDSEMATKLQNATSLTIRGLQEITDDFSEQRKIGQGGYGKVYVAKLETGEDIAVKILYNNMPGIDDEQFQHECDGLDWLTRYKIIKGTCKGLKHLHEGFGEPIYHLDLKPDNILLDENMVPKLTDFGLSKLIGDKQTMTTHSPIGTIGYLPMEFLHGNIISNKFDIFSFGVVMIKIIAGHGGYSRSAEMLRQEFLDLVHENWRNRMLKTCRVSWALEAYCEQVNICTEIALSCMEIDRHKRPNIADIVHRLNDTETVVDKALSWRTQSLMNKKMVKLEALTKSEVIPYAQSGDEYPILVRVVTPRWCDAEEEMPRPGVDLVVVLEEGYWDYIEATIMVIDMLGSNDRLSIVSGHGRCVMKLTFMSNKGRDVARLVVGELPRHKKEGTLPLDIVTCLREGAELLGKRQLEEEGDIRVAFIMVLLKQSSPNVHTPMPEPQMISSEFPVHIFDDRYQGASGEAMKYIADKTAGTYTYIHYHYVINQAVKLFVARVTNVIATSIKITLTAHEGIAISSIESGGYGSRVNSEGRSGEIDINYITAGGTKRFIVKLKLPEGKGKLITVGGHYWSLGDSTRFDDTDVVASSDPAQNQNARLESRPCTVRCRQSSCASCLSRAYPACSSWKTASSAST